MEVNLDDWYRPEVDRKKLKALSKRRDLPGLIHFFFYFLSLEKEQKTKRNKQGTELSEG